MFVPKLWREKEVGEVGPIGDPIPTAEDIARAREFAASQPPGKPLTPQEEAYIQDIMNRNSVTNTNNEQK